MSVIVRVPLCFIAALGVNVTEIVQNVPGARLAGQSLVSAKTPGVEIISITTGNPGCFLLPLGLDTFTIFGLLVVPMAVVGNLSDFGLILSVTATGVGVAVAVAVDVAVAVAVADAVAVGVSPVVAVAVAVGVSVAVVVGVAVAVKVVEAVAVAVGVAVALAVAVEVPTVAVDVALAVGVAVAVGVPVVAVAVVVGVAVAVGVTVAVGVAVAVAVALGVPVDVGVGVAEAVAVGVTDVVDDAVAVGLAVAAGAGSPTTPWIRLPSGQLSRTAPSKASTQLLPPELNSSTSVGVKSVPPIVPNSSNATSRCAFGSIEAPSRFMPSGMPAAALSKTSA